MIAGGLKNRYGAINEFLFVDVHGPHRLPKARLRNGATIQERSLGMPNYGSVLTLLLVKDIIEPEEDEGVDEHFTPDGKRHRW